MSRDAPLLIAREFPGLGLRYMRDHGAVVDWVAEPNLATDFARHRDPEAKAKEAKGMLVWGNG